MFSFTLTLCLFPENLMRAFASGTHTMGAQEALYISAWSGNLFSVSGPFRRPPTFPFNLFTAVTSNTCVINADDVGVLFVAFKSGLSNLLKS